ncbi:MAG TPA: DNA translocase FtsK [Candidatus Eisenbergiella merdavium]|uniref:DNA translocase FtsK n=1 Tax=Candidatus Eisenbergiella merdavium TaxID=2838551 RepID=A0A9D2SRF0_9FIRM|nr:DNA translocase FtsK [Candidatus Eisenbergiella merdavium]
MASASGSRSGTGSGTGKKSTSSSRTRSGSKTKSGGKRNQTKSRKQEERAIANEIILIAVFALCVLLFLCNFGVIGPVGNAVSSVMFGLFGMVAYAVPVLVFVGLAFGLSNRGNFFASLKIAAGILLFILIGVVLELVGGEAASMESYSIVTLYTASAQTKTGGGVLSGSFAWLMEHFLGMVGAVLLVIVLAIICLVIVTEKSFVGGVKTGSRRVYESAREDAIARRERAERRRKEQESRREREAKEREEEEARRDAEKILRMDKKVFGVMPNLTLSEDTRAAGAENTTQAGGGIRELRAAARTERKGTTGGAGAAAEDNLIDFDRIRIHSAHSAAAQEEEEKKETVRTKRAESIARPEREEDRTEASAVRPGREQASDPLAKTWRNADVFRDMKMLEPLRITVEPLDADQEEEKASLFGPGSIGASLLEEPALWTAGGEEEQEELFAGKTQPEAAKERLEAEREEEPEAGAAEEEALNGKITELDEEEAAEDDAAKDSADEEAQAAFSGLRVAEAKPSAAAAGSRGADGREARPAASGGAPASRDAAKAAAGTAQPRPKEPPRPYQFPPLSLLKRADNQNGQDAARELKNTAVKLQQTLATFGVKVTITDISQGPAVTRYELQPEQGVKVSKIKGLEDDIKLNLAATDIRIEAPIPGKAAVGIEVPNKENTAVSLRELLESKTFREFPSKLAFAVGKDIAGKVVVSDIAKMPHMLIAGSTGSGKSVCINTLIMSILYKAKPDEVKLILVDPKVVELSVYNGIPHLLIPVVTDPKQASGALHWGVAEMESRYQKFADWNVRDLKGYNKKVEEQRKKGDPDAPERLPQIVIIVDELADLMMVAPGEVEESICRLAQLARAAGIHLIIATQRPSVDVITGLIKANMPSRAAFAVSSGVDSRTILDMNGAEKLLGKGDMLFYPQGYPKPARVQGSFVSDGEVSDVVDFLKNQAIGNVYDDRILEKVKSIESSAASAGGSGSGNERDPYFEQAGRFIIDKDKASIGMLQRMFKIGFNRAARIMDQLADAGVVGEEEGTKPRKILMSEEQFEQYIEETL